MAIKEEITKSVRELLTTLSPDERIEFIAECMEGYCQECGVENRPCYCKNDD